MIKIAKNQHSNIDNTCNLQSRDSEIGSYLVLQNLNLLDFGTSTTSCYQGLQDSFLVQKFIAIHRNIHTKINKKVRKTRVVIHRYFMEFITLTNSFDSLVRIATNYGTRYNLVNHIIRLMMDQEFLRNAMNCIMVATNMQRRYQIRYIPLNRQGFMIFIQVILQDNFVSHPRAVK